MLIATADIDDWSQSLSVPRRSALDEAAVGIARAFEAGGAACQWSQTAKLRARKSATGASRPVKYPIASGAAPGPIGEAPSASA